MPERSLLPIQDPESLTQMLDLFIEQQLNGPLSQSEAWVRPLESKESFLNPSTAYFEKGGTPFMPFAMKLALPPDHRVMTRWSGGRASFMANGMKGVPPFSK